MVLDTLNETSPKENFDFVNEKDTEHMTKLLSVIEESDHDLLDKTSDFIS